MNIGVVMDPIASIKIKKDTTFAMLLEAQRRGWPMAYMEPGDLYIRDGEARAATRELSVRDDPAGWFDLGEASDRPLAELDALLMRRDPPFDMEYIYATYVLQLAEDSGVTVVNRPSALRDCNEKAFCSWFPRCCPPTLISADMARLRAFHAEHEDIVVKPLDGFAGQSIFRVQQGDPNLTVVLETLTARGTRMAMAQRYLPEIVDGDKRILLVDGEPVPYALARVPLAGESRGNLAAGGRGVGRELTERDRWICDQVGPQLRKRGLLFVGLDVIGDYLTEVNVTSPTCIRELDSIYGLNIAGTLMDRIEALRRAG